MRYLKLLLTFWHVSVAAETEYRSNFVMSALNSMVTLAGAIFTLSLFYQNGHQLGGWPWHDALIVVGLFTILDGFSQTFLTPNRTRVTELVRQGTLDFVLLKPVDTQFWLSFRALSLWGIPNILLGIGITIYAGMHCEPPLHWTAYVIGFIPVILGMILLYSIGFALGTLTIWFTKLFNITMAMQAMLEAGRFPISAYPNAYRVIFTFILPIAFMTTLPAQTMLGRVEWPWFAGSAIFAICSLAFSRWFWGYALRSYTSASS